MKGNYLEGRLTDHEAEFLKDDIGHSADMKRNIRRVFWFFVLLFAVLIVYLLKFVLFDYADIVANPVNPRIAMIASEVRRGRILDADGAVLAETVRTDAGNTRRYPLGRAAAHLVGFDVRGRSGVESGYNILLQKLDMEVFQRIDNVLNGTPLMGSSLALTVRANVQQKAYDLLNGHKGGVVVMEPSTGKILAMASYPDFDPNTIYNDWEALAQDDANSPLLNRAAQGLYPPGSVFKIATAAAAYEHVPDYAEFMYDCAGYADFGTKRIHCFDGKAHGQEDIKKAFAQSCNGFFAALGVDMGADAMRQTAERLYFNKRFEFPLPHADASFRLTGESSLPAVVETSIGQGETLTSPLHMALVTSAVANGGMMMKPYVLDHVVAKNGGITQKNLPAVMSRVFEQEEAEFLKALMAEVVESGTGAPCRIEGVKVAAKTGTAENASGEDHGWFVAFAPADNPQVAVAIILENSGGPKKAQAMAKDLISLVLADNHE